MRIRWPFVWCSTFDQVERQLDYRDSLIDRLQRERDEAVAELRRMVDNALMGLGQHPVSTEQYEQAKQAEKDMAAVAQALENVDAESRLLSEALN